MPVHSPCPRHQLYCSADDCTEQPHLPDGHSEGMFPSLVRKSSGIALLPFLRSVRSIRIVAPHHVGKRGIALVERPDRGGGIVDTLILSHLELGLQSIDRHLEGQQMRQPAPHPARPQFAQFPRVLVTALQKPDRVRKVLHRRFLADRYRIAPAMHDRVVPCRRTVAPGGFRDTTTTRYSRVDLEK